MNLTRITGSFALATVLSIGALGGIASAQDNSTPPSGGERSGRICQNADRIESTLTNRIARIEERLGKLAQARQRAVEAGKDEVVARIDAATAKAEEHKAKAQGRLAQFTEWVGANCAVG